MAVRLQKRSRGRRRYPFAPDPGLREESVNLSGETSLAEAIDLLSLCRCRSIQRFGLMHVAAALNRPLVAVYGSTSPGLPRPWRTRSKLCGWASIAAPVLTVPAVLATTIACAN